MAKLVWAEFAEDQPIRIFRTHKDAVSSEAWDAGAVRQVLRRDAVRAIRVQVYAACGGECQRCSKRITWAQMHMDEKISRGDGGEISVSNGWGLCSECHIWGRNAEHSDRKPRFGEKNGDRSKTADNLHSKV
jgi:5-methylcytosine-specific restriction endonuclease McrA